MCVVWLQWMGAVVALKVYAGAVPDSDLKRLQKEVKAQLGLRFPRLVSLLAVSRHEGSGLQAFLVFEYMGGGSIQELLLSEERRSSLSLVALLKMACEVTQAVQFLHSRNVVHQVSGQGGRAGQG